ncbi:response regulator transcription factor [Ottowia thiooxydans]|uniref:response regulator transcription factor n=1 Tax=Ottowia thiooxydans TaxID=219182 RepID=UPI0006890EC6|nr:DNA-binding response regulator [Ottowia thiooxydans]
MDDDPDQLRLLVTALRNASYRVSVALNGDQGYARAMVLLPDLIFLDVRMPGRNGITIARLLKTNPATQHIPVLFISALTSEQERLAGLRAGAVDYISKPFYVDEILERARIHIALAKREKYLTPEDIETSHSLSEKNSLNIFPASLNLRQLATEFILHHINEPALKISDVASSLQVPVRRLNAVFEASDGISTFEFIRQERMRRAALMLGQSTLSIAEVAIEVGYPNPANFSTEFKKFWGISPTQLRNESQADANTLQQLMSSKFS